MWHDDKTWDDQGCQGKYPFACSAVAKPPPTEVKSWCDEVGGLHDHGSDKCFFAADKKTGTWEEAERDCKRQGGHLASIASQSENDLVYQLYVSTGAREKGGMWIGTTDDPKLDPAAGMPLSGGLQASDVGGVSGGSRK
eukprot:1222309-Rhodomonas_salina.1